MPCCPAVVDHVALARLYGEPLFDLPRDLYIPPDALQRVPRSLRRPAGPAALPDPQAELQHPRHPMAAVTRQYLSYVDEIRASNLELAAEYLLMAAMLIEIKSRMLLPPKKWPKAKRPKTRAPSWCAVCWNTSR
jgi:segregation and condensation protein A